ncbi:phosphate ABC transporter substrate-binding/OmpA family protein [Actibacterium sp. MT2.3-13A]|uniref:phosphate ABC transporter substrate-binding/OmpA family protein n=1 Tax=Actibacterium sp. MT2.3-13A TaxID=2828332 RepID=UPI001BA5AA94|nr:phosphate ABC transporter substrate-binding/OmpA family protein [Actibacterium sp. MT2.3-13A]
MIRTLLGAAVFAALFLLAPAAATAQDVTLSSRDGGVEISGTLLSFDGEFYRVDTVYGVLTLDSQAVLCDGPGCPDLEAFVATFTLSGARSMGAVLMPALLEAFAARRGLTSRRLVQDDENFTYVLSQPETGRDAARVAFRLSTSAEGFADLLAGEADMAMAMREVRPDEAARGREAGLGDLTDPARSRIVALDALVPVVSPRNPLREITVGALVALLSGQEARWPGRAEPVVLHGPARGSGLEELVADRLLAPAGVRLGAGLRRHDDDAALADAVARDPLGLAVTRLSETGNARVLRIAGACGMSPQPTRRSLKAEDYPFAAPLFLYTPARRLPLLAREFLDFLPSPAAQIVVRRAGFTDQAREEIPLAEQGERLANAIAQAGPEVGLGELQRMLGALKGAARLTTSFRFRGGSATLDAQSAGNVADLARALEGGAFDGRELIFVGFSDGEGGAEANRRIALRRAQGVRDAVRAAAALADPERLRLTVEGFGEALPMACDDSEWGRGVNRRVEVWLR